MRDSTCALFALSASRATPRRGAMDARAPRASPRGFASRGAASTSTSTRDDVDARRGGARATTRDAVGDDGFGLRRARGKREKRPERARSIRRGARDDDGARARERRRGRDATRERRRARERAGTRERARRRAGDEGRERESDGDGGARGGGRREG